VERADYVEELEARVRELDLRTLVHPAVPRAIWSLTAHTALKRANIAFAAPAEQRNAVEQELFELRGKFVTDTHIPIGM
jgi:hypothetical protein